MNQKYFLLYCLACLFCFKAVAQNVSSPYSILGIGDIENNDYGRYSASGSVAVSRRENGFYNFSNPASLTIMPYKAVYFDLGFRGRESTFKLPGSDTSTEVSKDLVVKRISVAFKIKPSVAFAVGLKPFSSSNYQYVTLSSLSDGATNLIKSVDGSGGIYQSYFSLAKEFKKQLSIGATVSWLFGSMKNKTEYFNDLIGLDIIKNETDFYTAAGLQAGIQYYSLPGKKWQHTIGLTTSVYTHLKGQNTTNYVSDTTTIKTLDPVNIQFKLPVSVNAAYSIANKNGLSLHLQGSYSKWARQNLYYQYSYTRDSYGINAGMEYSKKINVSGHIVDKYYVGWGVKMEQSYLLINNNTLNDYSITFGGGKNISRLISMSAGFEAGRRGTASLNQIVENYYQLNIGITLKDVWFGTKKFGRFN